MKTTQTIKKQGRPNLTVETGFDQQLIDNVYKEIDKYSITPTTFKSRTLEKKSDIDVGQQKLIIQQKLQDTLDLLKIKIDEIDHPLQQSVDEKLIKQDLKQKLLGQNELYLSYKTREDELRQYQNKVEILTQSEYPDFAIFLDHYSNQSSNEVFRYGLNSLVLLDTAKSYNDLQKKVSAPSQKSGKSNKAELPKTILHPLEMIIISEAINSIIGQEKKTVLIDIFARDDKEQIQLDTKTKLPETHTIVLYKNDDSTIIVVDPSNSTFSKYLASEISNLLVRGELMDQTLKVSANELKIYTPGKDIGPNSNQYRDCIDIAVKIAFGLKYESVIDVSKIMELPAIKEITNQKLINEAFVVSYESARIRQASEDQIRKIADKIMNQLNQQRKSLAQYENSDEVMQKILQQNIDSFKEARAPDGYKKGLQELLHTLKDNEQIVSDFKSNDINFIDQAIDLLGEQIFDQL